MRASLGPDGPLVEAGAGRAVRVRRAAPMRADTQLQVLDRVVGAIAVLVVHLLVMTERPAKVASHHETVLTLRSN